MPPSTRRLSRKSRPLEAPPNNASTVLSKPFPFLELPDPVRQRIYELQLESQRGFVRFYSKAGPQRCKVTPAKLKLNIMLTCRQIYQEAMPVLYRVNNFCVIPITTEPEQDTWSEEDLFTLQNDKWIRCMPLKGRNLIRTLELSIPLPPKSDSHYDYKNMRDLFPGLKSLTLFLDFAGQSYYGWWSLPEPEEYRSFYQKLKEHMPQARNVFLDARMLEAPEWHQLIETVLQVWNATPGRSAFITQDLHHAALYDTYKKTLEKALVDRLGQRGMNYQRLSYWDIRVNQVNNREDYPTDDDTDDEIECFDKFDAEKIVTRTKKHFDNLEHGQFWSMPDQPEEDTHDWSYTDDWSYW